MSIDMATYPAGIYELLIKGTVGTKFDSFVLTIELVDPCPTALITLLDSPIVDNTYVLRDPTQPQPWNYADIFTIATDVDCGLISVEFFNEDAGMTVLNTSLFDDARTPNIFSILETQDVTLDGTYPISYRAYHTLYPVNVQEKRTAFTMTVIDPCDAPVGVAASTLQD